MDGDSWSGESIGSALRDDTGKMSTDSLFLFEIFCSNQQPVNHYGK